MECVDALYDAPLQGREGIAPCLLEMASTVHLEHLKRPHGPAGPMTTQVEEALTAVERARREERVRARIAHTLFNGARFHGTRSGTITFLST